MTGRKRARPRRERAHVAERKPGARRWWTGLAILGLVSAAAFLARGVVGHGPAWDRIQFPAPASFKPDTSLYYDDFVGSDECEECHKIEYDAWKASTHGHAGGLPGEVRIIAPFNGVPIRFRDAVVTPLVTQRGRVAFRVQEENKPERTFQVAGVVGGGHMVGGGTQAFFAEFPDGTYRFLPFDFIRQEGVWFCQTAGRSDQGWTPITPGMALSDCNDWPPNRVLGSDERVANCQQCHGSQITVSYDFVSKRYDTRLTTLAINCESCHGPGRRHIEIADSDSIDTAKDIGVEALATRDKDGSLQTCFQCHAVKAQLQPDFISGKPLEEYFSDLLLLLSYRPYFPDGRIRLFAYQQQHLYSDCYLNGSMTCVDCHDPHSQKYRDIWGQPLVGRFSDGQCLDCHASKAEEVEVDAAEPDSLWKLDSVVPLAGTESLRPTSAGGMVRINAHTYHRVDTPGSRCIDCHMPYLQEPDVGGRLRYSRSDHTIPVPRPRLDALMGVENACVKCHRGRSFDEVQDQVREWYGELKPLKSLIGGLISGRGVENREEAARLMLLTDENYVALQFTNLSYFMLAYLSPDMPALEADIVERLEQLAESEDPDLSALALASLHLARGEDRAVRSYLAQRLGSLGENDRAIRSRWVWVLSFRANAYTSRNQLEAALTSYRKAAEVLPDDPAVLASLATACSRVGDYGDAVMYYRRSLAADPNQPITMVGLAQTLIQQGDFERGLSIYRQAIELKPHEPFTYFSLGNALLRRRIIDGAVEAFQQAVALDPAMAQAHFSLGRAYQMQRRFDEAVTALERGLEFDRKNTGAHELLARLQAGANPPIE